MKKFYVLHFGLGAVGKAFEQQLLENKKKMEEKFGVGFVVSGVWNSKGGVFQKKGLKFNSIKSLLEQVEKGTVGMQLPTNLPQAFLENCIIVDTTTSDSMAPLLLCLLKNGSRIVLANKRPLAGALQDFLALNAFGNKKVFHETTVGAGLPIIKTVYEFLTTGDEMISIRGCLSGTLGFICSELEKGIPFSHAVKIAKEKGLTESDPREDLSAPGP